MRFITEFIVTEDEVKYSKIPIQGYQKRTGESKMGEMLGESFGWQNPVHGNENRYRLEIEAFPMEKWIEFKEKILNMKLYYQSDIRLIEQYFTELESFGKPAGDTVTNQK